MEEKRASSEYLGKSFSTSSKKEKKKNRKTVDENANLITTEED
jgi:hypothetical protein